MKERCRQQCGRCRGYGYIADTMKQVPWDDWLRTSCKQLRDWNVNGILSVKKLPCPNGPDQFVDANDKPESE